MAVLVLSFIVLLVIVTAMSVGVLMGRKPIAGSCGGVGAALGEKDYVCDICGGDAAKCERKPRSGSDTGAETPADLFYNAGER